jgi:hypothetical protein
MSLLHSKQSNTVSHRRQHTSVPLSILPFKLCQGHTKAFFFKFPTELFYTFFPPRFVLPAPLTHSPYSSQYLFHIKNHGAFCYKLIPPSQGKFPPLH